MGHEPEASLLVDRFRRQSGQEEVEVTPAGGLAVFLAKAPGKLGKVAVEVFGGPAEERKPPPQADTFRQTFGLKLKGAEEVSADLGAGEHR